MKYISKIMKQISKTIVFIIQLLHRLDSKLTNFKENHNPNFYEDLAPIDNINDTHYIESLRWAIND